MKTLIELPNHKTSWYEKVKLSFRPKYSRKEKYFNEMMKEAKERTGNELGVISASPDNPPAPPETVPAQKK